MSRHKFSVPASSAITVSGGGNPITFSVLRSGPPGPPGPAGGGVYQHDQTVPSALWTVNHNFGRYVNVAVYSTGGVEMWAETLQAGINQALVYFDEPQTGTAICT